MILRSPVLRYLLLFTLTYSYLLYIYILFYLLTVSEYVIMFTSCRYYDLLRPFPVANTTVSCRYYDYYDHFLSLLRLIRPFPVAITTNTTISSRYYDYYDHFLSLLRLITTRCIVGGASHITRLYIQCVGT